MTRIFGTDGVRALANQDLTPELALRLGRALVSVKIAEGVRRPSILVGRDPRWSGELMESALVAGIMSAGGDAVLAGVIPTPGVAYLAIEGGHAAGAVISASHNPVQDNGIKFFGGDGFKLSDAEEDAIESLLVDDHLMRPIGDAVGRRIDDPTGADRYVDRLASLVDDDLGGLHVVVDCANGAASDVAPRLYERCGATVTAIHAAPNGRNINDGCGSTHPQQMRDAVAELGADIGIAHDGDADRLIAADSAGVEVDGDAILAILARDLQSRNRLVDDTVVTTVMTNLGFHHAMRDLGIEVLTTQVGDRYVLEMMRERDLTLGGEQSGHLISLDVATTGDGVLSALRLMVTLARTGTAMSELRQVMDRLPQRLVNIAGVDKDALDDSESVWDMIREVEAGLGTDGRVLVRKSGTEALVRVMVEAPTQEQADADANRIADVVKHDLTL